MNMIIIELSSQTNIFDLMGREVCNKQLNNYQVYIQKINYDDGSHAFVKNIKLN